MPLVKVEMCGKYDRKIKSELMDYIVEEICKNTSTFSKNVYVYINEHNADNVSKTAPFVTIDWTEISDRTPEKKKIIMTNLTEKLVEITGEKKEEIVILFTDIPLKNAMLGGITRYENPNWWSQ